MAIGRRWRNRLGDEATLRLAQASLLAPPSAPTLGSELASGITQRALESLAVRSGEHALVQRGTKSTRNATGRSAAALSAIAGAGAISIASEADAGAPAIDAAFVAAPSTCTGVLAARPAERWRFDAQRVAELARVQTERLAHAAARVRAGGRLVYATDSIEPDENQRRIRKFLAGNTGWNLDHEFAVEPASGMGGFVLGGYAARITRD